VRAAVGSRYLVVVESAGDLTQTSAGGLFGADSGDDAGRDRGPPARARPGLFPRSGRVALFREQALELVDGN
jgi:hypothetical protein